MSNSSLPKEVREFLKKTNSASLRAVLLSPCRAEGIIIFDPPDELRTVRGDFFPSKTEVIFSEITRCQLLLAGSGVELNVIMFPGGIKGNDLQHFRFELATWQSFEEANKVQP